MNFRSMGFKIFLIFSRINRKSRFHQYGTIEGEKGFRKVTNDFLPCVISLLANNRTSQTELGVSQRMGGKSLLNSRIQNSKNWYEETNALRASWKIFSENLINFLTVSKLRERQNSDEVCRLWISNLVGKWCKPSSVFQISNENMATLQ